MSGSSRHERDVRRIAARMLKMAGEPCILCGGPPASVGMWTPTAPIQDRLGRPPGKTRMAVYSLCRDCLKIPNPTGLIEDRIIASHEEVKYAADRN